jgi:DNA-binding HxlR family transcriptional regulator
LPSASFSSPSRSSTEPFRVAGGDQPPKTLKDRSPSLEDHGLIDPRVYAQVPPRVEDTLTPAGRTLQPVLTALAEWGRDHAL